MKTSGEIKTLAGALLKAQMAIEAAIKGKINPAFKGSKYADLSSIIDAVKKPLNDNGILFTQGVGSADAGVTVETMLLHTSGEWISETLTVPVVKHDAQGVGSAITYGRRYGLQALCGVPAEDDDGNAATKASEAKQAKPPMSEDVVTKHVAAINGAADPAALKKAYTDAVKAARESSDEKHESLFTDLKDVRKEGLPKMAVAA